jgi:hypothetical protein
MGTAAPAGTCRLPEDPLHRRLDHRGRCRVRREERAGSPSRGLLTAANQQARDGGDRRADTCPITGRSGACKSGFAGRRGRASPWCASAANRHGAMDSGRAASSLRRSSAQPVRPESSMAAMVAAGSAGVWMAWGMQSMVGKGAAHCQARPGSESGESRVNPGNRRVSGGFGEPTAFTLPAWVQKAFRCVVSGGEPGRLASSSAAGHRRVPAGIVPPGDMVVAVPRARRQPRGLQASALRRRVRNGRALLCDWPYGAAGGKPRGGTKRNGASSARSTSPSRS